MKRFGLLLIIGFVIALGSAVFAQVDIKPVIATEVVEIDADDPAVWVNRQNPAKSMVIGTDKGGSLYVFDLDGKIRQRITGLKKPNNVDVEYGCKLGGRNIDIAVLTEAHAKRLRIYEIAASGHLTEISGSHTEVFGGKSQPMGIGLYKRPADGSIYAIISRGSDPGEGVLGQYLLKDDGSGKIDLKEVRIFGHFSGEDTVEAVAVDDELGYVYYADESTCIRKYSADPDHRTLGKELGTFGEEEYSADREGIGLYNLPGGKGYVVCTDQLKNSHYLIYPREGQTGKPHNHGKAIKTVRGGANNTDGIEVVSDSLGPRFPKGALVVMNSNGRNFLIYDWRDIAKTGKPKLNAR
ncbi:MAG: phytase [Armatimonadetes bacterium]|jgi:3-phytase|nr:phytase [Armatimonadota bacterium]